MKKIVLAFLLTCCLTTARSQVRDTSQPAAKPQIDPGLLFHKAKKQKTTAWILLGAGAGVALGGYIIAENAVSKDLFGFTSSTTQAGTLMILAGAGSMIASIPFFISSGKKMKAATLQLNSGSHSFSRQLLHKGNITSIALTIKL